MDDSVKKLMLAVGGAFGFWFVFFGGTQVLVDAFITKPLNTKMEQLFDPSSAPKKPYR